MITHRNLLSATLSYFAAVDSIAPEDCILHAAPMSHGSGMYNFPHLLAGANQVIPESGHFEPDEIFRLCSMWRGLSEFSGPAVGAPPLAPWSRRPPPPPGPKTLVFCGPPEVPPQPSQRPLPHPP